MGLGTSIQKNKYLHIGAYFPNLSSDTDETQVREGYTYLGVISYSAETDDRKIKKRIFHAKKTTGYLNKICWIKQI